MFDQGLFNECLVKYKSDFRERFSDERYKWEAVKWFQAHWDINAENFYQMFTDATEKTYNLLASMNNFPRGMIQVYSEQEPETVRAMFINLFDESKDVTERLIRFQSDADDLCERLSPGKQHYQRPMAISVYLWLHDPDKYCIYKYTSLRKATVYLNNNYIPKKGNPAQNIKGNMEFIGEIRQIISKDDELLSTFRESRDDQCYEDSSLLTLATDIEIYISTKIVENYNDGHWIAEDYDSGITKDVWKKLIIDESVFDEKSKEIMVRMLDYGGQATCTQLSEKYGESVSFYNFGSSALAKRVAKETGCKLWKDNLGDENYWSILYTGRDATKNESGDFVWKMREELKTALLEIDLTDINLYADNEEVSSLEIYTKDDFLSEVYMTSEKYDTLRALLLKKKNLILQGAPGVGKTFAAKRLAYSIMGCKDESRIEFIQFHQNYSYEDFIMGYKPAGDSFELETGIFYDFCQKAANDRENQYFFIIDEINRGNLSKIFGELLMLIEADYRDKTAKLAYNKRNFFVPSNLYLIGMMNTADRSLALIDYALRRRFSFFSMEPGFSSEGFQKYQNALENEVFDSLIEKICDLNLEITRDSALGSGFCIGHSYFCGQTEATDEWMQSVVEYDIIPMLEEYWFDDSVKLQKGQNILRGVFND